MKVIFRIIHTFIFYMVILITFIIGTALTMLLALFVRKKYRAFQFSARYWSKVMVLISGARVSATGLENVPGSGPLIFAANHQGAADVLLLLAYLPRYFRFVIKKELFRIPFFGGYIRLAGYIPLDREVALASYKTINSTSQVLDNGECILIFPEGTRSKTGEVGPFKRGSLMLAMQTGTTIVPVGISGSFKIMPKGSFLINLVPVFIEIGKPISLEKYKGKELTKEDYEKEINNLRNTIVSLVH